MKTDTVTRLRKGASPARCRVCCCCCWLLAACRLPLPPCDAPDDSDPTALASGGSASVVTTVRVTAMTAAVGLKAAITPPALRRSITFSSPVPTLSLGTSRRGPRRNTAAPKRGAIALVLVELFRSLGSVVDDDDVDDVNVAGCGGEGIGIGGRIHARR